MLSFWASMHDIKLGHVKLSWQYYERSAEPRYHTWRSTVLQLLEHYGLQVYVGPATVDKLQFNAVMKRAIKTRAFEDMIGSFATMSRGELFQALHADTKQRRRAWYLDKLELKNVKELAHFRLHGHRLASETGAWLNIERVNRICQTCGIYEDEAHVLITCTRYEQLRTKYLRRTTRPPRLSDFEEAVKLLNSNNMKVVNNVCVFIRKAMVLHGEYAIAINRAVLNSQV